MKRPKYRPPHARRHLLRGLNMAILFQEAGLTNLAQAQIQRLPTQLRAVIALIEFIGRLRKPPT